MRLSTSQFYDRGLSAMLDQQSVLSKTQLQISTGRRILTPSDDPVGAANVIDLSQGIARTNRYQANGVQARARLSFEENIFGQASELLQRVRELAVAGNSDTNNAEGRTAMAVEVSGRLEELMAMGNARDPNNGYIFSGYQNQVQPFVRDAAGNVSYVGDQGQRFVQIGAATQIATGDAGSDVFVAIRNGNGTFATAEAAANTGSGIIDPGSVVDLALWVPDTYTITFLTPTTYEVRDGAAALVTAGVYQSGTAISFNGVQVGIIGNPNAADQFTVSASVNKDVFATVKDLVNALKTSAADVASKAHFHNAMNRVLSDLDQAMGNINEYRARVGTRLTTVDANDTIHQDLLLQLEGVRSEIQDLDYAEAASRLSRQQLALEASQQTFVKVQGLQLFNFLR